MRPARVLKSAIVLKPSSLLRFHKMLVERKYRALFSPTRRRRRPLFLAVQHGPPHNPARNQFWEDAVVVNSGRQFTVQEGDVDEQTGQVVQHLIQVFVGRYVVY